MPTNTLTKWLEHFTETSDSTNVEVDHCCRFPYIYLSLRSYRRNQSVKLRSLWTCLLSAFGCKTGLAATNIAARRGAEYDLSMGVTALAGVTVVIRELHVHL
ncbi:hypothetical protein J6590_027161 [Homalodisca vitripennis]|nr:hypothetical protein J6590_027161 [Homalodisca vitripennis]